MKKSIASFAGVLALIMLMGYAVVFGVNVGGSAVIPSVFDSQNGIRRGLDLVGGSAITYEAQLPDGYNTANLRSDMQTAQAMLRQRLTAQGFTEATVTLSGDKRLVVEIPNIKNPEQAVQTLGKTAQLKFVDSDKKEIMSGSDVQKATASYGKPTGSEAVDENYVQLTFKKDAIDKFAKATAAAAAKTDGKNYIAIMMDNDVISQPSVHEEINSETCVISGNFTASSAKELANLINIGQLPFTLKQAELRAVGPELGTHALRSSFTAAMIGTALVALFMVAVYRLPGFVSVVALGFYMVLEALALVLFKVNLSLPGIAGIILSIGMAVDANIVIFERIKDELRAGKSVKASIDSGFKRGFAAVFDSHVTQLIAAGVLYFMGTGTVVGFAMTLGLGVAISLFTALTVTHFLLNRMVDFKIKNPHVYGL